MNPPTKDKSLSNTIRLSDVELNQRFVKSLGRKLDGTNSHVSDFLSVTRVLLATYASFTLQDAFYLCKNLDLPQGETLELFEKWTAHFCANGRLRKVSGAYDFPIFIPT